MKLKESEKSELERMTFNNRDNMLLSSSKGDLLTQSMSKMQKLGGTGSKDY